jgi:hypothetical protein
MNQNGTKPTGAADWKKAREEGYVITLPSGKVARLRPVALDVLIMSGTLPDILTQVAAGSLFVEQEYETIAQGEMAQRYTELINIIVPAAFLEPKIAINGNPPAADEITLDDIDFADKVIVFNLATGGSRSLELFRQEQGRNVQAVSDSKSNVVKGKRTRKPKREPLDGVAI